MLWKLNLALFLLLTIISEAMGVKDQGLKKAAGEGFFS